VTRLGAGRSVFLIPVGGKRVSLLRSIHTFSEAHTDSYSIGTELLSRERNRGMRS
jgi:hypothetical protein